MPTANEKQIGGDHYKGAYQHWDFVVDAKLGYLLGNATKYVARWRKKNGLQDLEKARHYIEKAIEVGQRAPMLNDSWEPLARFTQGMHPADAVIIGCITMGDYTVALSRLAGLAREEAPNENKDADQPRPEILQERN